MKKSQSESVIMAVYTNHSFEGNTNAVLQLAKEILLMLSSELPDVATKQQPWQLSKELEMNYNAAYTYTPERWAIFEECVRESPYNFGFQDCDALRKMAQVRFQAIVCAVRKTRLDMNLPLGIALQFRREVFARIGQPTCLQIFRRMAEICSAETGYIDLVRFDVQHDLAFLAPTLKYATHPEQNRDKISEKLPGYCWGVLCNSGHVAALGGIANIKESAAYQWIDTWQHGDQTMALLRATEHVFHFSRAQRFACRQFLTPVLAPFDMVRAAADLRQKHNSYIYSTALTPQEEYMIERLCLLSDADFVDLYKADEKKKLELMQGYMHQATGR